MQDHKAQKADRKRRWIAPLILAGVAGAVVGAAELIGGAHKPPPPPPPVAAPKAVKPPPPPQAPPALTRTDLVESAESVADDYAAGAPAATGADPLVGRTFRVLIPFGCSGPQADPGVLQASYQYDPAHKALKITARAGVWTMLPMIQQLPAADDIESVEGFWVTRPWTTSDTCPAQRDVEPLATPTPPAAQTLGLAVLFKKDGSRVLRRDGRPYEFVRKVADSDAGLVNHAYRLVLEGRVTGYTDGRALRCWSESADHRPICLYGVEYDRVAFEDAASHDIVAEWKP